MTWRPRGRFRVGAMRERITVQTSATDESTGQPIRTWSTTYANEPAQWTPTSGGEVVRGQSIEAGISAVATVHYRAGYSPLLRVVYDGNIYGIVHVKRVDGGRRYIELFLKSLDIADRIVLGATADSTLLTADTTLTTADAEAS